MRVAQKGEALLVFHALGDHFQPELMRQLVTQKP